MTTATLPDTEDADRLAAAALRSVQRRWVALDDRWRRAGQLWRFRCLAAPLEVTDDHRRNFLPSRVLLEAVGALAHPVPVGFSHGNHDPGAVPKSYGEVESWEPTDDGVVATAVSAVRPGVGWGVSIRADVACEPWAGASIVTKVATVLELSILPPPLTPAYPSARVLEVEEVVDDGR